MAEVETPYYDPADTDEAIYPCKGCNEILEEGKAFELAGSRWHIDCFRCNTCGTLLDSDANLLLLGDGSLICNNCTYSCNACGNKIEDLAILTGDQAFCSACFRCRNCKKKIENLRYARTSQGIFCMSCHEALMARRRKRTKTSSKAATNSTAQVKEKALPSLPPGAVPPAAFTPDAETPPLDSQTSTPGVRSPPERMQSRRDAPSNNLKRDVSPLSDDARRDGPTLPASTYKSTRQSNLSRESFDDDEQGFLTMAFDPSPIPGPPPTIARKEVPRPQDPSPPAQLDARSRDYFGSMGSKPSGREMLKEDVRPGSSRSVSTERERDRNSAQAKASPHILSQAKGAPRRREVSGSNTPASGSAVVSPLLAQDRDDRLKAQSAESSSLAVNHNNGFKLQEAPKTRRTGSRTSSQVDGRSPALSSERYSPASFSPRGVDENDRVISQSPASQDSGVNPFDDPKRKETGGSSTSSAPSKQPPLPVRGDSLVPGGRRSKPMSPETNAPTFSSAPSQTSHERTASLSSAHSVFADAQSTFSGADSRSKPADSPSARTSFDAPPPRASSRTAPVMAAPTEESFTAPRPPPPAPAAPLHRTTESIGTMHSSEIAQDVPISPSLRSAGLPKQSLDKPFSMEEDMARILRGDARRSNEPSASVLRKVSNAVKHGRSFSDRGLHSAGKSSSTGNVEISSPMTISSPMLSSPRSKDSNDQLAAQLRRAQQKIVELESEVNRLESQVNSSADIKAADNEIKEKRGTMIFLDSQREMVVRELEVMTEHLARAKANNKPLDLNSLQSEVLQDFAESLHKLKDQMSQQIEELMSRRNELTDEIGNLIQMKDKGFQEYEILSSKNAQLAEMNNKILQNIQDMYKSNRGANGTAPMPNGLGIYHPDARPSISAPSEVRQLNMTTTDSSMPNLLQENEAEPATILTAPQVVNIRKGQPKKFNWRKGGERVAKNVTKGIKGAFVSERKEGDPPYNIGMPYNQTQQPVGGSDQNSLNSRQGLDGRPAQGFGFFGQKNPGLKPGGIGNMKNNSSTNLAADASVLFGSELEARCEYEKRVIPHIVSRCIDEVEARGMDMEGIYRKSGGSGQVKLIQQGFEKDTNFDITDEDLDIHAVTSALKQYFRKLPTPLITYDAYDSLLEAGRVQEKEKQAIALRGAVMELPEHHRDCLEFLVLHLVRVMAAESSNLMTPLNLAVVFAPTIMRPATIEREMSDMQAQRQAVQALLELNRVVFPDE
ncbi:Rho-type gtpase-activating protein [Saxophila tyrrhenica]|uniref:Rho-type gtpase-activating protein n=1 Tax=Saxophila tyrrhenica TaxID=1690608 RepID=A0AAV9PTB6_9PEZI|nr:Rho-type gtpase-activating protein [Saxophila tyrrhenica]